MSGESATGTDPGPTTAGGPSPLAPTTLLRGGVDRLRSNPRAALAILVAGVLVAAVDRLRATDPVPAVEYAGVRSGSLELLVNPLVAPVTLRTSDPSALPGLEPGWLAWTLGLELAELVAVVAAVTYAVGATLDRSPSAGATLRYGGLLAVVNVGAVGLDVQVRPLVAVPLLAVVALLVVRLFAVPGLVVAGDPVVAALRRSWRLTAGAGGSLLVVVLALGVGYTLAASVPVAGPVASGAVAAVHAGVLAAFLARTPA